MANSISVVICTRNRLPDMMRCMDSILAQTLLPDEVVVIDSSTTDELKAALDQFADKINIKYLTTTLDLSHARNIGIDNSAGDIITYLDDDVILDKDCLKETVRVFDDDIEGDVGGATGEMITELNKFARNVILPIYQVYAKVFLLLRYGDGRLLPSGHCTIIRPDTVSENVSVEYVVGANMSFRRKVMEEIRFDEGSVDFDDNDISFRVSRKYKVLYTPRARFVHARALKGGRSHLYLFLREIKYYRRFFKKSFPQTPKYRLAFYWAVVGMVIKGVGGIILRPVLQRH